MRSQELRALGARGMIPELDALPPGDEEGQRESNRRWDALEGAVIPRLAREIHRVESALEEEARDEAVRGRRLARARTRDGPSGACSGWSV